MIIKIERSDLTDAVYRKGETSFYHQVIINTKNIFSIEPVSRDYDNEEGIPIADLDNNTLGECGLLINGQFVLVDLYSDALSENDENSLERIMEKTEKLYNKIVKAMEKE